MNWSRTTEITATVKTTSWTTDSVSGPNLTVARVISV